MGSAEIVILGCGGSGGTPLATGHWAACDPNEPRNLRTRPSIAIITDKTPLIVDTGADFRAQTLRENIHKIDSVIYTHAHADHIMGMDDLRYAAIKQRVNGDPDHMIPIYSNKKTDEELRRVFNYMYQTSDDGLYVPMICPNIFKDGQTITHNDLAVKTFTQIHGGGFSVGLRIGDVGYSTDISDMTDQGYEALNGIKTWIVDCGQYGQSEDKITVHPNLERVLRWNDKVGAQKLYLTHLTPRQDYETVNNETADDIECAYDGLRLDIGY